jgi:GNAT superfamily N-acetyltransferase
MNSQRFDKDQITIEKITRQEVEVAIKWAEKEGWNPGIHDAECFFNADPTGFYAAKINGEIVGTVSAVKYLNGFAFEGLYIVRPDFRGKGIGALLQKFVDDSCKDLNLGLDGVLRMQCNYFSHGFTFAHKNSRYAGTANDKNKLSDRCTPISRKDFSEVAAFDANFFFSPRIAFLQSWLFQKDTHAFLIRENGTDTLSGYGVIRKCMRGNKIGPLFANDPKIAKELLGGLMSTVPTEEVFLDVPESNLNGVALASRHGMQPVFSTARMYTKQAPALPLNKIFGITSFELG